MPAVVLSFGRPHPLHPIEGQIALMTGKRRYIIGKHVKREHLVKAIRIGLGDVIEVKRLALLAEPRRKAKDSHKDLWAIVKTIEKRGATIKETETGLHSINPDDRDEMLKTAGAMLRKGLRGTGKANGKGRRKRFTDPKKLATMKQEWLSTRHKTDALAIAALCAKGFKVDKSLLWRYFGPSGRGN